MRKLLCLGLLALMVIAFTGCISGGIVYNQPTSSPDRIKAITVNKDFDYVWKKLINGLGDSYYVINTIEKVSGIINLSYSGDPKPYIDCGSISSDVSNARGKRSYVFDANEKYKEYEVTTKGLLFFVKRKLTLNGRINVIVQKVSSNETTVKVRVRYIAERTADIQQAGIPRSNRLQDTMNFDTGTCDSLASGTTCCSKGKMENDILDIVR